MNERSALFAPPVAALIADYSDRLAAGHIEVWQLPNPLSDLAWTALEQAPSVAELRQRLARAEADADRYYRLAFEPRRLPTDMRSLATLERLRGYPDRAARLDADMRRRFGEVA